MNPRFYLDGSLEEPLILSGDELHHLAHVLRIRVGEEVELVNGRGSLARAQVKRLTKEKGEFSLLDLIHEPPSSPSLFLGISLIRLNRLEWTLEKGTELGADGFILFPTERSEQKSLSHHQLSRFRHLSLSALKQCGRLYLPEIIYASSLSEVLARNGVFLFGDLDGEELLIRSSLPSSHPIIFLTGPEGGFSPKELEKLREKRATGIRLHKNTLRAETAPLAALYSLYLELNGKSSKER
jgi:16S rRNA (uracil1498-N3)-methyltransferase